MVGRWFLVVVVSYHEGGVLFALSLLHLPLLRMDGTVKRLRCCWLDRCTPRAIAANMTDGTFLYVWMLCYPPAMSVELTIFGDAFDEWDAYTMYGGLVCGRRLFAYSHLSKE